MSDRTQIRPDLRFSRKDLRWIVDGFGGILPGVFYTPEGMDMRAGRVADALRFDDLDHFARAVVEGRINEEQP